MGYLDILNREILDEPVAAIERLAREAARIETKPTTAVVFDFDAFPTPKDRYEIEQRTKRNKSDPAWCRQMHYKPEASLKELVDNE